MALPLSEIHELEVTETYPDAIDELEKRIAEGYADPETVTRLGFNLWYAVSEEYRLKDCIPADAYRSRFVDLWRAFHPQMGDDPDFCWAFGLGALLYGHEFDGISEDDGERLLERAAQLDPCFEDPWDSEALSARFSGRGILESYYSAMDEAGRSGTGMETVDSIKEQIRRAFAGTTRPRTAAQLSVGGLDGEYVEKHFLDRSWEDFEDEKFFGYRFMEDFLWMTPKAACYYLQAVLRYMLREPTDTESWIFVHGFLKPEKSGRLTRNLRGLTIEQRLAIADWASFLHDRWMEESNDETYPWWEAEELATTYQGAVGSSAD